MRVLVTGAAGFIGSHVVDRLIGRGDSVWGVDNFDAYYSPAEKRANLAGARATGRFTLAEVDLADEAALWQALEGWTPDVLVHLAAKPGVRPSIQDPLGYTRTNVLGTQVVLEAARRLRVRRAVVASSSSVYGNASRSPFVETDPCIQPLSPYGATKRAAELLAQAHQQLHGGRLLCLRFFTVYGPRQRPDLAIRKFCTLMAKGRPIPLYGDGSAERDYTWVDDILAGVLAAIDWTGAGGEGFEIVNLGGNRTTALHNLVELLGREMGVTPSIQRHPWQPAEALRTYADVSKAAQVLGYWPSTPIEVGLARFVEWFKSR